MFGNMPGTSTKNNELQYLTFSYATNKHSRRKVTKMMPEGSLPLVPLHVLFLLIHSCRAYALLKAIKCGCSLRQQADFV
jgi:hypothetical protein